MDKSTKHLPRESLGDSYNSASESLEIDLTKKLSTHNYVLESLTGTASALGCCNYCHSSNAPIGREIDFFKNIHMIFIQNESLPF